MFALGENLRDSTRLKIVQSDVERRPTSAVILDGPWYTAPFEQRLEP